MKLNRIAEAIMGSAEYSPPRTPMQLVADFYLFDLLIQKGRNFPSGHAEILDKELAAVEATLLPFIKQHLLEKAGYAIVCESIHFVDAIDWGAANYSTTIVRELGLGYTEDDEEEGFDWEDDSDDHVVDALKQKTLQIMVKRGMPKEFVEFLAKHSEPDGKLPSPEEAMPWITQAVRWGIKLFTGAKWEEMYGGRQWELACELWLMMKNANTYYEIRIAADRIFQLQHNTGALLNKNPEYDSIWLLNLLNLKYHANHPEQLMRMASPFMRRLASYVLGIYHGRGWDSERFGPRDQGAYTPNTKIIEIHNAIETEFARSGLKVTISDSSEPLNLLVTKRDPNSMRDRMLAMVSVVKSEVNKRLDLGASIHVPEYKWLAVDVNDPYAVHKVVDFLKEGLKNYLVATPA